MPESKKNVTDNMLFSMINTVFLQNMLDKKGANT